MIHKVSIYSGGGCKGNIAIQGIAKQEFEVGPLYDYYDLMAGTSVGAINAAFLATGKISAERLCGLYPKMIKRIFKRSWFPRFPKYKRSNFVKVWDEFIGSDFKMKDCKCKLLITSVNLMDQRNHFFKSWQKKDGQERLMDVVLRSFAAPLYFGKLIDQKNQAVWFDGGMGTSNLPIDQARIEARDHFKWKGPIVFDAFGCGFHSDKISFKKACKYKTIRQIGSYFDLSDGGLARSQSRAEQVSKMKYIAQSKKNIGFRYWDVILPKKLDKLDGVKYLAEYRKYGIEMLKREPLVNIGIE